MNAQKFLTSVAIAICLLKIASGETSPAPSVTLSVSLSKPEYLIGEPIIATLSLANHSDVPFLHHSIDPYDISVNDEARRPVHNPHTEIVIYSGFFPETRIEPGQHQEFKVDLNEYCAPSATGTYTVRLAIRRESNRGWPGYPPEAVFPLRLRVPTPQEAEAIIGQRARQHGGFRSFSLPVYTEPLKTLVLAGNPSAMDGLARIPTVGATLALLTVARAAKNPNDLNAVVSRVFERLPGAASTFVFFGLSPLRSVPNAVLWNDACAAEARELGRELLGRPEALAKARAANLLAAVGERRDVPQLASLCLQALQEDDGSRPDPFGPERLHPGNFGSALEALAKRGQADRGDPMKDPVWAFVALHALPASPSPHPAGWHELVTQGFASPYPALRSVAIRSIPFPAPPEFAAILAKASEDRAENVRAAALFVSEHKIDIPMPVPHGSPFPPSRVQVDTGKPDIDSQHWQVAAYDAAIVRDPNNADAYDNRGVAKYELGQLDQALADFDHALRLRPRLAAAFNNRGLAWAAKAEDQKAIADYEQALSLDPKMTEAYFNRGLVYAKIKQYAEALKDFDAVIDLELEFAAAFGQRAAIERALGQVASADTDVKHADALDPAWRKMRGRPRIQAGSSS